VYMLRNKPSQKNCKIDKKVLKNKRKNVEK